MTFLAWWFLIGTIAYLLVYITGIINIAWQGNIKANFVSFAFGLAGMITVWFLFYPLILLYIAVLSIIAIFRPNS